MDPASARQRELTARAIIAGCVLGLVLCATNVYAGLKIGYLDSGNLTASIVAFAFFAAFRGGRAPYSVLENNITATAASSAAMMGSAIGLVGPICALELLGYRYPGWAVAVWGSCVAVLGVLLAVATRSQMLERDVLPFPTGVATAEVILALQKEQGAEIRRARLLLLAAALAGAWTWFRDGKPSILPAMTALPLTIGGIAAANFTLGMAWSPLMLGTGVLVGMRNALSMLVGGILAWGLFAPWAAHRGAGSDYATLVSWLMWPGVAMMVASAFTQLALQWRTFARTFSGLRRFRGGESTASTRRAIAIALLASLLVVVFGWRLFHVSPLLLLASLALALVLTSVSTRAAGETDMAPIGAMGGLTQILVALVAPASPVATLTAGTVVSGEATQMAQMMWSFRAGKELGSSPRAQVGAQLAGLIVGAVVSVPAYALIRAAYGIGSERMPAAAPLSWKATAEVVQRGFAAIPAHAERAALAGAVVGIVLTLWGARRKTGPILSPIALGTAFLIPASYAAAIFVGASTLWLVHCRGRRWSESHDAALGAGAIAGESLVGVIIAILTCLGLLS